MTEASIQSVDKSGSKRHARVGQSFADVAPVRQRQVPAGARLPRQGLSLLAAELFAAARRPRFLLSASPMRKRKG